MAALSGRATSPDHPRLRGEHQQLRRLRRPPCGSPPPARGAPLKSAMRSGTCWITPACAGSTSGRPCGRRCPWDHPRLRGEHSLCLPGHVTATGSPPPARGAPVCATSNPEICRITPACAGSTEVEVTRADQESDHLRLRGEHGDIRRVARVDDGSPPPARGAPPGAVGTGLISRITPACAGSTLPLAVFHDGLVDHPRLRGEHAMDPVMAAA